MMFRTAIAVFALALPVFAQRGSVHAGSIGNRGFAGHSGISGNPGFARSGNSVRSAPTVPYPAFGISRLRAFGSPNNAGLPISASRNRFMATRPTYRSMGVWPSRTWDRDYRNHFDGRRRSFENWHANIYPGWLEYGIPYGIDPGFYDWGDSGNTANDQGGAPPYDNPAPYSDSGYGASDEAPQEPFPAENPLTTARGRQPYVAESGIPSASDAEQSLTVVFKGGRAPARMQNYMITARILTDLDSRHYEQIPIDQIDVAATQQANRAAGVGFEIPGPSGD